MPRLMRCPYCGILQDEPAGAKLCIQCGGELEFETGPRPNEKDSYISAQLELDQVMAPLGQNIERYLLVTVSTPRQVPPAQAAPAKAGRPPIHLAAVLDVSGSMRGEKLNQAKSALQQAVARLQDDDLLSLVIFETHVRCVMEPRAVNAETRQVVNSLIKEIQTGNTTALCAGLELGIEKAVSARRGTTLLLLLSDGLANEGVTDAQAIGQRARAARDNGIVVSALGIGNDYDESLLVEIANQGGGRFYDVEKAADISAYLTTELGDVANAAARDAQVHLTLPTGAVLVPLSAAYAVSQSANEATVKLGDIPCDLELEIALRAMIPGQSQACKLGFQGALVYQSPAGKALTTTLNRVTVRFTDKAIDRREGVVTPIAERVLHQLKASEVLAAARAMRQTPSAAPEQARQSRERIRAYATLLGDERAAAEDEDLQAQNAALSQSPAAAKAAVARAYSSQRSTRQGGRGKKS